MPNEPVDICALTDLMPERGAAALVNGTQVAVFRLLDDSVIAVQNLDPYSGANVMSRGLVGTHRVTGADGATRDVVTVTTPMLKQVWNAETGEVLDAAGGEPHPLTVFPAQVQNGRILITAASSA